MIGTRRLLYMFRIYPFPRVPSAFEVVEDVFVVYYFRRMRCERAMFTGSTYRFRCRARVIFSAGMRRVFQLLSRPSFMYIRYPFHISELEISKPRVYA